ncbi:MAG TPA: ABC transporter transmembrane domain-containing protein, partial [Treponemataceae bacterium]|nr:ABC transporter transmembrane domain-containing protein [Treponemataceae bacterium]
MLKEYRTLFPYLKKYRFNYIAGFVCLIVVDGAQLLIPQFIKKAIDTVSQGSFRMESIFFVSLSIIGAAVLISSGRFLWRFFIIGASRRIETELRDKLFDRLLNLPLSFFQRNKTGDLMARATNDMSAIRQATAMGFVAFIDGVFMSGAILIIMIVQNPSIALLTVIPLPIISLLIIIFGTMIGKRFTKVQEIFSRLSDIAQETISGIRVIKAFVKEDYFEDTFSKANDEYRDSSMSLVKVAGLFFPLINFLAGLTIVILLFAGGGAVLENRMSAGDIVAMLSYLQMLIWPMIGAGFTVNLIQRGAASLKRVNEILEEKSEMEAAAESCSTCGPSSGAAAGSDKAGEKEEVSGRLLVKNLSYSFTEKPVLNDISFTLDQGQTLGILGSVGSGKSTLIKLLVRLIEPTPGTIFIGEKDVRDISLPTLRKTFGVVPQDSFLFSETVEANIRFGSPELSNERFDTISTISTISRDVETFPASWETIVGEKGLTLSGGQKQRI